MITFIATMRRILLAVVIALIPLAAIAQDYDKGLAAAQAGDFATALKELLPLAEKEDAAAQYHLGVMYYRGEGVPQDYAKAARWYRLAADQGHAKAQVNLARMYAQGISVPLDYVASSMWYEIAAANGENKTMHWLEVTMKMTPKQLEEAERRTKVCMESNYKDCD